MLTGGCGAPRAPAEPSKLKAEKAREGIHLVSNFASVLSIVGTNIQSLKRKIFFMTNKKRNLDTTIIFRWDSDKERFLLDLAKSRRLSMSQYLRLLLDRFVASRGLK